MGARLESLDAVQTRARAIRLAVFDVDGVLTDGGLLIDADGRESKRFHVHDGHGLKSLIGAGIDVAVISARESAAVSRRMSELGIQHVHQGERDKLSRLSELCRLQGLSFEQVCYCGDDVPDLTCMSVVGLACSVADASASAKAAAHWISARNGGCGAVRELCELLLAARPQAVP
jgi:3-deoxy-D-manno-octulosonate 8-phosphate phosphatase (KDO 8-P phosphatase)